uniref:Uncharacterized protein n=1 Tax=Rhizophora mucronata TaxID=61149 RepID=A0A2P2JH29_RHIMU
MKEKLKNMEPLALFSS